MIEILDGGLLTTMQDEGRPGRAALGVARAGAFDRSAYALGNRLVGNPAGAAALELVFGGLSLRALHPVTIALTGAPCPGLDWGSACTLGRGQTVTLGRPSDGVRSYLAVRGGLLGPAVLGSLSTDVLGRLGPEPVRAGDRLAVGPEPADPVSGATAVPRPRRATLRVHLGPREDWFRDPVLGLTGPRWTVRAGSNRVGLRLDGPPLARAIRGELPSEPLLPGALQVPPDGRPILIGPDGPVTGGYPVIGVVLEADLDRAAQLAPGDPIRFALA